MKCMAGFSKEEDYFVPRSELPLPEWIRSEDLTGLIFPDYDRWMCEQNSPFGDSSEAARNFLFYLLPFLARVIFQDGIYWIS